MPKEMFKTIEISGINYVVKEANLQTLYYYKGKKTVSTPQPNFMGSGMALCGVLKKRQTIESFIKKYNKKGKK